MAPFFFRKNAIGEASSQVFSSTKENCTPNQYRGSKSPQKTKKYRRFGHVFCIPGCFIELFTCIMVKNGHISIILIHVHKFDPTNSPNFHSLFLWKILSGPFRGIKNLILKKISKKQSGSIMINSHVMTWLVMFMFWDLVEPKLSFRAKMKKLMEILKMKLQGRVVFAFLSRELYPGLAWCNSWMPLMLVNPPYFTPIWQICHCSASEIPCPDERNQRLDCIRKKPRICRGPLRVAQLDQFDDPFHF